MLGDPPEAEARALLGRPLYCEDPGEWVDVPMPRDLRRLSCGLVDENGVGTRLMLQLDVRKSAKTGIEKYVFSIFRLSAHGLERIYQLDVEKKIKGIAKNEHNHPHEHFGAFRSEPECNWVRWGYKEILSRFCLQTGVQFRPSAPDDPLTFKLKQQKWEQQ